MGLDVGEKKIGVAISDPLGITAQGLTTIARGANDLEQLSQLVTEWEAEKLIVGMPRSLNGTYGPQAAKVTEFIASLESKLRIPVETWDERLTTIQAEKALLEADVSRRRRRQVRDKIAAVFILRNYLDAGAITRGQD